LPNRFLFAEIDILAVDGEDIHILLGKAAQNNHPGPFRPHIAIRRCVKHLAAAAGGKHARAGKTDEGIRGKQQIDAAHHGGFQGWIVCQGPCREMQRDK
jgi:hypothetical protein